MAIIMQIADEKMMAHALSIRRAIFVDEQGIPEHLEYDGHDTGSSHVIAIVDGNPVGTGRLKSSGNGQGEIARIAVLPDHRGQSIGRKIVIELESIASGMEVADLYLNAHQYLETFYGSLGYHATGEVIRIDGYDLIRMHKHLKWKH